MKDNTLREIDGIVQMVQRDFYNRGIDHNEGKYYSVNDNDKLRKKYTDQLEALFVEYCDKKHPKPKVFKYKPKSGEDDTEIYQ